MHSEIPLIQRTLSQYLHPTPLVFSHRLTRRYKKNIWLKLENFHPTHSFKIRPAYWSILNQLQKVREKGVIASSSGNFAQAVAYAARELGVNAEIVMMRSTSPIKIEKTKAFGGRVVLCEPNFDDRIRTFEERAQISGAVKIFPFDSEDTINANAVLGLEIKDQIRKKFTVICPVSGGGLAAGISKAMTPDDMIFAVQPAHNPSLYECLKLGHRQKIPTKPSIADAIVAPMPGEKTFPILQNSIRECILLSETEISNATSHLLNEEKIVAEPAGAMSVAALSKIDLNSLPHEDVICIISGGNGGIFRAKNVLF